MCPLALAEPLLPAGLRHTVFIRREAAALAHVRWTGQ